MLLSLIHTLIFAPPQVRVLLVGAGRYDALLTPNQDPLKAKLCGDTDVKILQHVFETKLGVPSANIKVLTDPQIVSKDSILKAVKQHLIDPSNPGDCLVFWWSGHGTKVNIEGETKTLQAIVPSVLAKRGDQIESKSLLLGRELQSAFSPAASKGVDDCVVVFDSCYSGNAFRGPDDPLPLRFSPKTVTPLKSSDVPQPSGPEPKNMVVVSAGREAETVRELKVNGVQMAPLTASFCLLADRLDPNWTYRQLRYSLSAIALANGEDRVPQVQGPEDRRLLGGGFGGFTWEVPVSIATTEVDVWSKGTPVNIKFPPGTALIPLGQFDGVSPGTEVELFDKQRNVLGTFKVGQSDKFVSSLVVGTSVAKVATAIVKRSTFSKPLNVTIDSDLFASRFATIKLAPTPYLKLQGPVDSDTLTLANTRSKASQRSSSSIDLVDSQSGILDSAPADASGGSLYGLLLKVANAQELRSRRVIGNSLFEMEAEVVPATMSDPGSVTSRVVALGETAKIFVDPPTRKDWFAIRVRARLNPKAKLSSKAANAYLQMLYIYPDHQVHDELNSASAQTHQESFKISIAKDFSEWTYLGLDSNHVPQSALQSRIGEVIAFQADEQYFDVKHTVIKLFLSDEPLNLTVYESRGGGRGKGEPHFVPLLIGSVIFPTLEKKPAV
jgi:hypothetical protein